MKAHIVENGVVVNTIEVVSLDSMPNLVEGSVGGIGWTYESGVLKPPPVNTLLSAEQIRLQRSLLLAKTDWTQLSDVPQITRDRWAPYRQALRDVPQQPGFPLEVQWPTQPE